MGEQVKYEYKDGNLSIELVEGYSDTHNKAVMAIIGALAEEDIIDEENLIEIEQKIKAIRKQKFKGVWYYGE